MRPAGALDRCLMSTFDPSAADLAQHIAAMSDEPLVEGDEALSGVDAREVP